MRWTFGACLIFVAAIGAPAIVIAAPPPDAAQAKKQARVLAEKGIDLMEQKQLSQAIDLFRQAEALFHAPTHLLLLARCHAELRHLVEAKQIYDTILGEALPKSAPDAFRQAQKEAKAERDALAERMPKLRIEVRGDDTARAEVRIDGKKADDTRDAIEVDPGPHDVSAWVGGAERATESVLGSERTERHVVLVLTPAEKRQPEQTKGPLWPGIGALALGGAGLGVGAITGALSLGKVNELDQACPNKAACPPGARPIANEAAMLGDVSTATFVAGGLLAAAGAALLIWRPGGEPPTNRTAIAPIVGPGFVGVTGTFR